MYGRYSGYEPVPAPVPARDDAKLYRHCVIVVLLCVMAAVMVLSGMPTQRAAASGQKAVAESASGWSQVLVKLEEVFSTDKKS